MYPYNDTMFGIRFQSFLFLGNYSFIYIHCKAFVCELDEKFTVCDQSCDRDRENTRNDENEANDARRRSKRQSGDENSLGPKEIRVDKGPIEVIAPTFIEVPENFQNSDIKQISELLFERTVASYTEKSNEYNYSSF